MKCSVHFEAPTEKAPAHTTGLEPAPPSLRQVRCHYATRGADFSGDTPNGYVPYRLGCHPVSLLGTAPDTRRVALPLSLRPGAELPPPSRRPVVQGAGFEPAGRPIGLFAFAGTLPHRRTRTGVPAMLFPACDLSRAACTREDSNPEPTVCKTAALPLSYKCLVDLTGAGGSPATSAGSAVFSPLNYRPVD